MRTTVRLADDLLDEVRRFAVEHRLTLTAVLERALREMLARQKSATGAERPPLPTFRGNGLQPGVDLDDGAALLDLMDRLDGPA